MAGGEQLHLHARVQRLLRLPRTTRSTQSLVAKKASFRWLNHGLEHIYQGCIQDFSVIPWRCATDSPATSSGCHRNRSSTRSATTSPSANTYGFRFNPTEYLSGEHSGLFLTPQQLTDNPNFVAAVSQAGLTTIGADASREPRPVRSAPP